jgi:hypothetical protein
MKRTRSLSMLLVSSVAVVALVSSCTIETKTSDGGDGGSTSGTTGGTSSGTTGGTDAATGGSAAITGGSNSTTGGAAATTGGSTAMTGGSSATTGGASSAGAGGDEVIGGNGGAGGEPAGGAGAGGASYDDCDACLDAKCTKELDACSADSQCISDAVDGSGQYEQVAVCVDTIRKTRPVKRADLRDCGNSVGQSSNNVWPPGGMTVATIDLINCMATGVTDEAGNSAWANQANISNAWAPASCAKLACTSQLP